MKRHSQIVMTRAGYETVKASKTCRTYSPEYCVNARPMKNEGKATNTEKDSHVMR